MTDYRCRAAGHDQPRMLRTHQPGCDTSSCAGCAPCPERHCQRCGHEHVTVDTRGTDLTCASCIRNTRGALDRIRTLEQLFIPAATERGVNSLVAAYAGPAADTEAHGHIHRSVATGRLCRCRTARGIQCPATLPPAEGPTCAGRCGHPSCDRVRGPLCPDVAAWHEDCRDELHPLWVLGTWDFTVRDHLNVEFRNGTVITVNDAADFLGQHLTRLAHDDDFDFAQLAIEVEACATHLEEILAIAPYTETGAPCPSCGRAELEKVYGDTEKDDRWTCPKCRQWWTEHDYRAKVSSIYPSVATALTASQIAETYRVAEATVRQWAARGKVTKRGKDSQGRMLYDVAQVLEARDGERVAS